MTAGKVVDASAIAAVLFDELTKETVLAQLRGAVLYAPTLLRFEVASVATRKMRARPAERDALIAAFDGLATVELSYVDVDLSAAIAVAGRCALTLYDACYLWLAQELQMNLVTLDARLGKTAARLRTG